MHYEKFSKVNESVVRENQSRPLGFFSAIRTSPLVASRCLLPSQGSLARGPSARPRRSRMSASSAPRGCVLFPPPSICRIVRISTALRRQTHPFCACQQCLGPGTATCRTHCTLLETQDLDTERCSCLLEGLSFWGCVGFVCSGIRDHFFPGESRRWSRRGHV